MCEITFRAYALCDLLTVTVNGSLSKFSFGEYVADCMEHYADDHDMTAALRALYAYGMTARILKA